MIKHIALTATTIVGLGLTAMVFVLPTPDIAPSQDIQAQTYITNVRLVDGSKLTTTQTIQMENGIITAIEPGLKPPINMGVIDGAGLTALPGLIDSHAHSYASALADALRYGVTVNLDMFSDVSGLLEAREARDSVGKTARADLFSSGMMATAPGGHGTQYGIPIIPLTQASQAKDWVRERKAEGSDYIKMVYIPGQNSIPTISREIAKALITAAHEEGLMALAHISTQQAALDLMEDGIDGLVHIFADKEASPEVVAIAMKNDVFIIPTLSVIASVDGKNTAVLDDLNSSTQSRLSPMQKQTLFMKFPGNVPGFSYETALKNVKLFHNAGVTILAGSDAPNPGTAHGVSLHMEMAHLVKAGLTPDEALSAATDKPAAIFNLKNRGALKVGRRADLVLINGNPLQSITDTMNISYIIKNGHDVPLGVAAPKTGQTITSAKLSDFENGLNVGPDLVWSNSDDKVANGKSEVVLSTTSNGQLNVKGEVKAGFPYPWAGASIALKTPSAGLDISKYNSLEFSIKGTPGTYRLMTFHEGAAGIPPTQEFAIDSERKIINLPLEGFSGFDSENFMGFAFVAGPVLGAFEFQLDDVTLKQ